MRQVPRFLLIGSGRVARHFQHYLSLLHLPFDTWARCESLDQLGFKYQNASHVLLLISDRSIDDFVKENLPNVNKILVHFSGSLVSQYAVGAHPLMTFNQDIYSLEQYKKIAFVIDDNAPAFENLLPGFPNTHVRLASELKSKYHAMCVLGANFSCLLWQKFFSTLEHEFNFPVEIMQPFLMQQTQNLLRDYPSALTGPLVRNDTVTIQSNLAALESDPFQEIYKSFLSCYQKLKSGGLV